MWGVPVSACWLLWRRRFVKDDGSMTVFPLSEIEKEDEKNGKEASSRG